MNKNKELIVVGITSKIGSFICKYPFLAMLMIIISIEAFGVLYGENIYLLFRALWIQLIFYSFIFLLIYIASNKWCYKIILDTSEKTIIFFILCNRSVCSHKLDNVKIVITSYCHIFVEDSDYILHADYIHDLVSFLPKDTAVEYKGHIGRYKEKHWIKGPLIPGNRL